MGPRYASTQPVRSMEQADKHLSTALGNLRTLKMVRPDLYEQLNDEHRPADAIACLDWMMVGLLRMSNEEEADG